MARLDYVLGEYSRLTRARAVAILARHRIPILTTTGKSKMNHPLTPEIAADGDDTISVKMALSCRIKRAKAALALKTASVLAVCALAFGCAAMPPLHIDSYSPTSTMSLIGRVNIGEFRFLHDHIQVDAGVSHRDDLLVLSRSIDEYFADALLVEARFVGVKIDAGAPQLTGTINRFNLIRRKASWLDNDIIMHWMLQVAYAVNGCYSKTHTVESETRFLFSNVDWSPSRSPVTVSGIKETIKLNIEKLFADKQFQACIQK
ncbi:MAG: hypothetical protein OD918_05060 [Gammaproteobacteria bacterium]